MFNYKFISNDDFISNYEKESKKNLLKGGSILVGIVDLLFLMLIVLALLITSTFNIIYFSILVIVIVVLQGIVLMNYSSKKSIESAENLRSVENRDITINIEESGVSIYSENLLRHIAWNGISEIKANDKEISFYYKVNGIVSNIFYFEFFEASKDEVISEIEKFKIVRKL